MASTRAADGRDYLGRGLSSLIWKFPADAQGDGRPGRLRSPTGTEDGHPDELVEPGVQGRLVAPARPGHGGAPSPSLPHFAGGDTLDALTLSFLVQHAVLAQEKEKEEKKRKEKEWQDLFARRTAEYVNSLSQSSSSTSQRRRKKRKKKKLPKSGCRLFLLGCGRPCDHASVLDMPGVLLRQVLGLMVQKTVVLPQLQSIACRRHFFSFRRGRSSRSRFCSRPQRFLSCCSISGCRCPGCAGRAGSFHRRGSEAVPHGPEDLPSDHCLFPVAKTVADVPVVRLHVFPYVGQCLYFCVTCCASAFGALVIFYGSCI